MKFGLAGHKEDPLGRTLKVRNFLVPGFVVPQSCDLAFGLAPDTDPLGNDDVGDCALAGPGHFARWEDQRCEREALIDRAAVIREYSSLSGYVPGDESTDVGAYALDVMKRWRSVGLFGAPIDAFAQVDFYDPSQVQAATFLLGGWFACYALPAKVASGPLFEADTWDETPAGQDGGFAGNHLVWCDGTDTVNSWGRRILVTPAFRSRRCYDGYAVVSQRGLQASRGYAGIDLAGMMKALAVVTG